MECPKKWVDVHVHLAALPTADNGCRVSRRALQKPLARLLLKRLQIDPADPTGSNRRYVDILVNHLRSSRWIKQAVLLALDGVYDARGQLDRTRTHFLISNDYLLQVCRAHAEFLPGVSINPLRRDALDELDRCAAAGAVLVKVLPNSQGFNPADRRCRPFYRRLAEHRLPLLSHMGHEFSLVALDQSLGDPSLLRPALDEGVTVIGAHAGSSGLLLLENLWLRVRRLMRLYPHFYLDSSALGCPNRFLTALKVRHAAEWQERLLYGSDYPVPVVVGPFWGCLNFQHWRRLRHEPNPLDRHAELQAALNYRFGVLRDGSRLAALLT